MRTIACFASTLDGHIASGVDRKNRIGSRADLLHLRNVRTQADAILCGGETFREYPNVRRGHGAVADGPLMNAITRKENALQADKIPLQCILTRKFDLPPEAPVFTADPAVPIIIFSPEEAPVEVKSRYPQHVEWVVSGKDNPVPEIQAYLAGKGVQTLLVEGGGHVMSLFLQARALNELYLTLCPLFVGLDGAPNLLTGPGFTVAEAPRTEILELEKVDDELYLHLQMIYPQ